MNRSLAHGGLFMVAAGTGPAVPGGPAAAAGGSTPSYFRAG
ncbi:hypothetical protein [Arthrobacter sp. PAMC 25486]|nr:hypothetical protein [Arthrobacter sp. PAMC 25486]